MLCEPFISKRFADVYRRLWSVYRAAGGVWKAQRVGRV